MFVRKREYVEDNAGMYYYIGNVADDLWEGQDDLWEALSELSALVEFLVEKQEKAQKPSKPRKVASPSRTTKKA